MRKGKFTNDSKDKERRYTVVTGQGLNAKNLEIHPLFLISQTPPPTPLPTPHPNSPVYDSGDRFSNVPVTTAPVNLPGLVFMSEIVVVDTNLQVQEIT